MKDNLKKSLRILLLTIGIFSIMQAQAWGEDKKEQCANLVKEVSQILDNWTGDRKPLVDAKAKLDAAMKLDPKYAPAYAELTRYFLKSASITKEWGDKKKRHEYFMKSLNYLRTARKLDPKYYKTNVLIGYVLVKLGDFSADEFFKDAATTNSTDGWLNVNWGELLLKKGDLAGAQKKFVYVLQSETIAPRIKKQAASFLIEIYDRTGQISKQNETYLKLLEIDSQDAWTLHSYGNFNLYYLVDYEKAIKYQVLALEKSRTSAAVLGLAEALYVKWADYLINKKDPEAAKEIFQQATQLVPDTERIFGKLSEKKHIARLIIPAFASIGVDLNKFHDGETLLIDAAKHQKYELVTALVEGGADVNLRGSEGRSALHYSAYYQDIGTVEYLLAHGANVNATDDMGRTPLIMSLARLDPKLLIDSEVINVLIQNGADPNIKSFDGWAPLTMAIAKNLDDIVELLKDAGAKGKN